MHRIRRFTPGRLVLALLLVAVFSGFSWLFFQAGNYFDHLDAYSGHVARQDQSAARDGLKDLEYFYRLNRKLDQFYLGWVGDKYLLRDFTFHESAFFYLSGDFEKVVSELRGEEGFWAYYLRGNARWRQAQGVTANALTLPDKTPAQKAEKEKQLKLAEELAGVLARDDYAEAVKASSGDHLPSSWNHDLVSDPDARKKGLMPKPGKIKVRLGESAGGSGSPGPQGDDSEGEGKKSKDLDTNEEGPGNPQGRPRKSG